MWNWLVYRCDKDSSHSRLLSLEEEVCQKVGVEGLTVTDWRLL